MLHLVLISAMLVAQPGPARPPADALMQSLVRRYVRQLEHREGPKRAEAEQKLISMGPKVLSLLPTITPRTSAEVKERLGRVRKTLELVAVEAASKATSVTLEGEMTLGEALKAIEKQTGNRFEGTTGREMQVTAAFKETPFWQALDNLLDQANLDVNPYSGQRGSLQLTARPDGAATREGAAHNSIFRFTPLRIEAVRELQNPALDGMRLTMRLEWEPRIHPVSIVLPAENLKVQTDDDKTLSLDGRGRQLEATVITEVASAEMEMPLSLAPRGAKKLASVKGSLETLIPGRIESFEFTGLSRIKGLDQQRAGVTVTFDRAVKNNELFDIQVRVRFDKANDALASHSNLDSNIRAYLLDADGRRVENDGVERSETGANEAGFIYIFDTGGSLDGYTFVFQTPAAIVKKTVDFELKDIPLP